MTDGEIDAPTATPLAALRRTLAVYRMVFGQSRQEDLVSYLLTHVPEKEIAGIVEQLRIDLTPPKPSATGS